MLEMQLGARQVFCRLCLALVFTSPEKSMFTEEAVEGFTVASSPRESRGERHLYTVSQRRSQIGHSKLAEENVKGVGLRQEICLSKTEVRGHLSQEEQSGRAYSSWRKTQQGS